MYSSQITEWRKLRDAGLLAGKKPGEKVGRPVGGAGRDRPADPGAGPEPPSVGENRSGAGDHGKSSRALGGDLRERGHATTGPGSVDRLLRRTRRHRRADPDRGGVDRAGQGHPGPATRRRAGRCARAGGPAGAGEQAVRRGGAGGAGGAELAAVRRQAADRRSTPPCWRRARICARSPRCTGSWARTRRSRTGAGRPRTRRGSVPELQATGPRQVYSWDITKLAGPAKGQYFDCYVMIDIYSRYIVGAHVHHTETAALAVELMTEVFGVQGVPQVVHADRGTSMTSKPVAALLDDLRRHPIPFPAKGFQRQPVLRGVEQDDEIRAGVPRAVHLAEPPPGSSSASSWTTTTITIVLRGSAERCALLRRADTRSGLQHISGGVVLVAGRCSCHRPGERV